ncbi:MAG: ribosome silencing factor [Pirellulales bacterium]|nr:ribosome silencing factor [Pirellulales bacterium]
MATGAFDAIEKNPAKPTLALSAQGNRSQGTVPIFAVHRENGTVHLGGPRFVDGPTSCIITVLALNGPAGYIVNQALSRFESGLRRALLAAQTAEDNRGDDIVVLDTRELTSIFDYFVIATGTSRRQIHAMSEEIDRVLEDQMGDRRLGIEGYEESRWILLDYGDVVVHLFEPDTRRYYALEELWGRAKRVPRSAK